VRLAVEFLMNGRKCRGVTTNMSSSGVFVLTTDTLGVNKPIRLSIEWPAILEGRCPLCLAIQGRILRATRHGVAVGIEKYEFRLRPSRRPGAGHSSS